MLLFLLWSFALLTLFVLQKPPLIAATAFALVACSGGAVRAQATTAAMMARASNAGLDLVVGEEGTTKVSSLYESQQIDAAAAACGNANPCADPQAAREAVFAVRARWAPVWSAWSLAAVAHVAWSDQLRRCQSAQVNDGTDCTIRLAQLLRSAMSQTATVRCALQKLGVTDPFPGSVVCGGAP